MIGTSLLIALTIALKVNEQLKWPSGEILSGQEHD